MLVGPYLIENYTNIGNDAQFSYYSDENGKHYRREKRHLNKPLNGEFKPQPIKELPNMEHTDEIKKKLDDAIEFTKKAHEGQTRRYSGEPYANHPIRVYKTLLKWGIKNPDILLSGLSHDFLEDLDITYEQLKDKYGDKVAQTVRWLSNEGDKNTHIKKIMDEAPLDVVIIKISDRCDNLNDGGDEKFFAKYRTSTDIIKDGMIKRNLPERIRKDFMEVYNKAYPKG